MARTDKVCFDRVLPNEIHRPLPGRRMALQIGPTRAAFEIAKLWPNGRTLHIRFLNGTDQQQQIVREFAPQWTEQANLTFAFDDAPNAEIRIAFNDDGAWSYVGTDALGIPGNQPTMNFGWQDEAVVLHEFGHMIGMIHEHQNPDDNPIEWNKPVVIQALGGPPNNWDLATIQHNMFDKYNLSQINGSEFDPASVMLYSFPPTWTLNDFHSEPNDVLSDVDKEFAARVYPGRNGGGGGSEPVELPVIEGAFSADIGQPGEEDLYTFTAKKAGRYVIETEGPTDLVMKLFGSGSVLIDQDDDGGVGRNSRIDTALVPGEYLVQVRHYNSSGGTGNYAIKVVRTS
ncbi:M12 family metallopeptidase [Fuerstiella marisgermanici]|uniref:Astacin (Peptidase family M12A) n=1 Tax=Fuerstiella marisgermanici TaxID=1891926 RepID=A0A1P8WK70_9PLAN|nr:M12 family metallopeptidase [Fuerstiella marisgermanici]APZ94465.1 Astacin (Peptidase family M12A) [Fuerstiella marisgermanici]